MKKKAFIYTDDKGYCRVLIATNEFKHPTESEEQAIARLHEASIPSICDFLVTDLDQIQADLCFRDAWRRGNINEPITIDFKQSLDIHRSRLKMACERKVAKLNLEHEIAEEKENLPLQVAIRRTKAIVRNLYEMNLTHCKTIEDIKYSIPKELHDVWDFYPPTKEKNNDKLSSTPSPTNERDFCPFPGG